MTAARVHPSHRDFSGGGTESPPPLADRHVGGARPSRPLDQIRETLPSRHSSQRAEHRYRQWVKRFIFFYKLPHPVEMGEPEINAPLTYPAAKEKVGAATQNQALYALLFHYRHGLGREVGDLGDVVRTRKPRRLPVVMTREKGKSLLASLVGDKWLMASLMNGAGLGLAECLLLRVQDIDFSPQEIIVRDGKGAKGRVPMLPASSQAPLPTHLKKGEKIYECDVADGLGRVLLPGALDRKHLNARGEWRGQWFFPRRSDGRR